MLRVGETVTHLSLGSSGKPCIRRPPWGWLSSPVPGNAGLHMAGLVSVGCGQLSWAVPEASRAPLPVLRWPHCLLEPLCKFSQPLFTHPPVEAGGCGLCLVSSWARGRPSLPRPARAPSTPGFGHFPVAPWCDLRPGLPWIGLSWIRSSSLSVQAPGCCPHPPPPDPVLITTCTPPG